jgi:serine/threonine-protein kinase RsbW
VAEAAAAAGVFGTGLDDVRAGVSEAVTNAILHGFRDGRPGTVSVSAGTLADRFRVTVSDDGVGFGPRTDSPGLGLGLSLLGVFCASFTIGASSSGGTEVCMEFPLVHSPAGP